MIRAVIFDMDGLLTDSERIGLMVMHECALKQGVAVPISFIIPHLGATKQFSCDRYHAHYPALDTERLYVDFRAEMFALAERGGIPLKKGAKELLAVLNERRIPCAVASSSSRETVALYMRQNGVLDCFTALVGGGELASKPAPDIFLKAAELLNASPSECLVLEDSWNGTRAGRAAGMTVAMVPDVIPYSEQFAPYCDHVLNDLTEAIPLLGQS